LEIHVSVVNREDQSSREFRCPLEDRVVVGRGPECGVPVDGPAISREHLILEKGEADAVLITDVSANGCWINGVRVPKSRRLPVQESDVVEIPGFEVRIRLAQMAVGQQAALPAAPGAQETQPAARRLTALLAPLAAFTPAEKFTAAVAMASLGLVVAYALS
jgi:predicted component of type VI protein secretion system